MAWRWLWWKGEFIAIMQEDDIEAEREFWQEHANVTCLHHYVIWSWGAYKLTSLHSVLLKLALLRWIRTFSVLHSMWSFICRERSQVLSSDLGFELHPLKGWKVLDSWIWIQPITERRANHESWIWILVQIQTLLPVQSLGQVVRSGLRLICIHVSCKKGLPVLRLFKNLS